MAIRKLLQRRAITLALEYLLSQEDTVLLGEDLGTYGGAFQVTAGLASKVPEGSMLETPISESGFTGLGIGLALAGYKTIVEYMYMDFVTQAMDQIVNQAVKFEGMYNGQVYVPILFRAPSGAYTGHGPTHSQSFENILTSIPGLQVVYPYSAQDYYSMLVYLVTNLHSPVFFIENKSLYLKKAAIDTDVVYAPEPRVVAAGDGSILIISYGHTIDIAIDAMHAVNGRWTVVDLCSLKPIVGIDDIAELCLAHEKIVIASESPVYSSVTEHLATELNTRLFGRLKKPITVIGSKDSFIPARKEDEHDVMITIDNIIEVCNV